MENASKALVIAGSVLIAIILISIGIYIISANKGTIDVAEELGKTLEVQTYNATFEKYAGSNRTGAEVRNLLTEVKTHNARNSSKLITVNSRSSVTGINNIYNRITPNNKYSVSTTPDTNGYITSITIKDSSGNVVIGT